MDTPPPTNRSSDTLPVDVIYEIIRQFAAPPIEDAYVYEDEIRITLCSLCLVNRGFYSATVRHLYARVNIALPNQLELFLWTGPPAGVPVRSLSLGTRITHDVEGTAKLFNMIGHTLERLMIYDPERNIIGRVMCGREDNTRRPYTGPDFPKLPVLRELACVGHGRASSYTSVSQRFPSLTRLLCYGVQPTIVVFFHSLEVLIVQGSLMTSSGALRHIIDGNPNLRRILIILPRLLPVSHISKQQKVDLADAYRDRLSIFDVYGENGDMRSMDLWFIGHVRHGTIWTLKGINWLDLNNSDGIEPAD